MGIREYEDIPRIYLDMDGPLSDFDSYCAVNGFDPEQAKLYSGTYLNLQPTEDAIESVKILKSIKNFDLFVLSKIPRLNPGAATEKHFWLQRYFPVLADRLILSPDKGCIGTYRDLLIDDHPEWANAKNFPGTVIGFGKQHNTNWRTIIREIQDSF